MGKNRFGDFSIVFLRLLFFFFCVEEPFLVESWNYSAQLYCAALVTIQLRKDSSRVGYCEEARRRCKIFEFAGLLLDPWFRDALYRVCYCHDCSVIVRLGLSQAASSHFTGLPCFRHTLLSWLRPSYIEVVERIM